MIQNKNILFVVHRYYPFPGGSEFYVQNMAEEMVNRGHEVTILTGEHKCDRGIHNEVRVATDISNALNTKWDLIIVHGGDVNIQNSILVNAFNIKSPILYMIIKPSESIVCVNGLKHCDYLACSTSMDIDHVKKFGFENKIRRVRHGIPVPDIKTEERGNYYVSAGGFWPHKAMQSLALEWDKRGMKEELHLYGYGMEELAPATTSKVKTFFGKDTEEVHQAIANSKGYIMNSYEEGFGLVLLEAMMMKVPWYARNIAGAYDMKKHGVTYYDEDELFSKLEKGISVADIENAYKYAIANHSIESTVNDIENVLLEREKLFWT